MEFLNGVDFAKPIKVTMKTKEHFGRIVPILLRTDSRNLIIEDAKDPDGDLIWLPKEDILSVINI